MATSVIVNPASANGRTGRRWGRVLEPRLRAEFPELTVHMTTGPGDATRLTRTALQAGAELVVAVGGDGTMNEVVNGFFDGSGSPASEAALAVLPCGTGGDFAKTLGISRDPHIAVAQVAAHHVRTCDIGRITMPDGAPRYFLNIADLGVGGELVERLNRSSKALGGFASYLWHLLAVLATFPGRQATVRVDDRSFFAGSVNSIVVANGQYFGGGMHVAPGAQPDDGLFEVVVIEFGGFWETVRSLPLMYRGQLERHPRVHVTRGRRVEVVEAEGLLMDVDGEHAGLAPAVLELLPGALRVCSAPPSL